MKHLVFISGKYLPDNNAVVMCVSNIIGEMQHNDSYKITCICATTGKSRIERIHNVQIHRVHHVSYSDAINNEKSRIVLKIRQILHFLHSVLVYPLFPNTEPSLTGKFKRTLEQIERESHIDCIIATFRPWETLAAMVGYRKKHAETKCIAYFLDVLRNANPPRGLNIEAYVSLCDKREQHAFKFYDKIILPEKSRSIYDTADYEKYKSKISYANFPALKIKKASRAHKEGSLIRCVFAGTTNSQYRNPEIPIKVFEKAQGIKRGIFFDLYGRSDMYDSLTDYSNMYSDFFCYHGEVDKSVADIATDDATFLVSIGNTMPNMVPSKTFEMMGYKKPIIHFFASSEDPSINYLKNYPDCILLNTQLPAELLAKELCEFFDRERIVIEDEYLLSRFYSATPQALVDLIIANIQNDPA